MVKPLTSVGRSGLSNWLLQRISALIMSAYLIFMVVYFFVNPSPSYEQWLGLHSSLAIRIFSLLTILSIAAHASLGVWCVLTDYITVRLISYVLSSNAGKDIYSQILTVLFYRS